MGPTTPITGDKGSSGCDGLPSLGKAWIPQ